MAVRGTQVGAEVIIANVTSRRATQVGAEVIISNVTSRRATQVGAEIILKIGVASKSQTVIINM